VGTYTSVAVDGSKVYISYCDGNGNLKLAKSVDGGATWLEENITTVDATGNKGAAEEGTSLAVEKGNIYISYFGAKDNHLQFARSSDDGKSWKIITVDNEDAVGAYNSIAVKANNVYISYCDLKNGALKFAKSADGGLRWLEENKKTIDTAERRPRFVEIGTSLAVEENNVYISYYDAWYGDLKFAKSVDGGATWPKENIKTVDRAGERTIVGENTSLAVKGKTIYIGYWQEVFGRNILMFAKSPDGGATWPTEKIMHVDSSDTGTYLSLTAADNEVFISYRSGINLRFAKSSDEGSSWQKGNTKTIDATGNTGNWTSHAVNGRNLYISYFDEKNGHLKFAKSIDRGASW
jgi:hypothetical protein